MTLAELTGHRPGHFSMVGGIRTLRRRSGTWDGPGHVRRGGGPDDVRLKASPLPRPSSAEFSGDVGHTSAGPSDDAAGGVRCRPSVRGRRRRPCPVRVSPLTGRDGVRTVAAVPDDLRALGWDATLD